MTQVEMILAHMRKGNSITPLEALTDYGCFRLADVIFKIKAMIREGEGDLSEFMVCDELVTDTNTKKRFSRYWIERINHNKLF